MNLIPLTIELAKTLKPGTYLYNKNIKNRSNGEPLRAKVNGAPKTWKTRPLDVRVPVKHGLYNCFYVENTITGNTFTNNLDGWCVQG